MFLMSLLPILLYLVVVSAAAGALYSTFMTVNLANLLGRAIVAQSILQYGVITAVDLTTGLGAAFGTMHDTIVTGYGPVPRHLRLMLCCTLYILSAIATTLVLATARPLIYLLRRFVFIVSSLYRCTWWSTQARPDLPA